MDAALGFLGLCAQYAERAFSPSVGVDRGWHTFLLYTAEYAEFCQEQAGRFIHHAPNDDPDSALTTGGAWETTQFMRDHNIAFDADLWATAGGQHCRNCNDGGGPQCHCGPGGGGCTCS